MATWVRRAAAGAVWLLAGGLFAADDTVRGLPFTRSFPLEEIGNAPRGARLTFDEFGRLAVVYEGVYSVLNDTVWLDLADQESSRNANIVNVVRGRDGRTYYGARGSWGLAARAPNGRLKAQPLMPPEPPAWTRSNSFADLVATNDGVYFAGWNGIVFLDAATHESRFFELSSITRIFRVGDRVYVSAHGQPLHHVDLATGQLRAVPGLDFGGNALALAAPVNEAETLVATRGGQIFTFDGERAAPWTEQARHQLAGDVSALQPLVEGGVALAITGKGLFQISATGELNWALTTPQYHRIGDLATSEPGVLWIATEDSIDKLLYGNPLTSFGQRVGLPASWPKVMRWGQRLVVMSQGRLYEPMAGAPGAPTRFRLLEPQPAAGAWAVATQGDRLLVGNAQGVFAMEQDGGITPVSPMTDIVRLVTVEPDLCYAIGRAEIGVLRWADGSWKECAPRIPAVGEPSVAHATAHAVWVELGANRVARVAFRDGKLVVRVIDSLPWKATEWINVGIVDNIVVLTGSRGHRVFFDERTQEFCAAPELERLLAESPLWLTRMQKDPTGTLWATHDRGVVTFTPTADGFEMDSSTFDLSNDNYPAVQVLPGNDVWISARQSLHHVERRGAVGRPRVSQPALVSIVRQRTDEEILGPAGAGETQMLRLPFADNSLSFRFFAGTYAWRRAPAYEFRLDQGERWTPLGSTSLLTFPQLREGRHRLEVRFTEGRNQPGQTTAVAFELMPPWYRTWPAYATYGAAFLLVFAGLVRWSSRRAHERNQMLQQLVRDRTRQLEATMQKLNEETRNAATLAERDRLAGEIHDSLQQGLSGLMLQIDATLKLPAVTGDVRSRLHVARNMVSFTRHEVQHAIWDMETPLLENTELAEALRKLTALINSGSARIELATSGPACALPSATQHHLLRIAQEAITNAVRHAAAQHLAIRLEYRPTSVSLEIVDDGVGFDPESVMGRHGIGHFGLRGLRSRAAKTGGELRIESAPGRGTSIRVIVPLPTAAPVS